MSSCSLVPRTSRNFRTNVHFTLRRPRQSAPWQCHGTAREEQPMTEKWKEEKWAEDIWYRGKLTRRRLVGWGCGAIGALMLVPAPWRAAFGAAKPYKIGSEQPLSGPGGAGGKTAVVGLQMAVD